MLTHYTTQQFKTGIWGEVGDPSIVRTHSEEGEMLDMVKKKKQYTNKKKHLVQRTLFITVLYRDKSRHKITFRGTFRTHRPDA